VCACAVWVNNCCAFCEHEGFRWFKGNCPGGHKEHNVCDIVHSMWQCTQYVTMYTMTHSMSDKYTVWWQSTQNVTMDTMCDNIHIVWLCTQYVTMYTMCDKVHRMWQSTQNVTMYTMCDKVHNAWQSTRNVRPARWRVQLLAKFYKQTWAVFKWRLQAWFTSMERAFLYVWYEQERPFVTVRFCRVETLTVSAIMVCHYASRRLWCVLCWLHSSELSKSGGKIGQWPAAQSLLFAYDDLSFNNGQPATVPSLKQLCTFSAGIAHRRAYRRAHRLVQVWSKGKG